MENALHARSEWQPVEIFGVGFIPVVPLGQAFVDDVGPLWMHAEIIPPRVGAVLTRTCSRVMEPTVDGDIRSNVTGGRGVKKCGAAVNRTRI